MNEAKADGRRPDRAAFGIAAGLAAIGAVVVFDSYRIPDKPGYSGVGAGDVPWIVGVVLICLAAATVVSGLRGGFAEMPRQRLGPVAWILGGLLVQLFTIHTVGFILATGRPFRLCRRRVRRAPVSHLAAARPRAGAGRLRGL